MTNAPERIWIEDEFGEGDDDQWTYGTWDVRNYRGYVVEYVRADIVQALTAERDEAWAYMSALQGDLYDAVMIEAERDRLRGALTELLEVSRRAVRLSAEHDNFKLYAMEPMERAILLSRAALKGESHE